MSRRVMQPLAVVLLALLLSGQTVGPESLDQRFDREVLIIETAQHGCFRFDVHLALTSQQQQRGLMFIRELPEWSGMLFIYKQPRIASMWMKNTFVPLDIVFARSDGAVSSIVANTEPQSLKSISAIEPVNYVLELNTGTAERLGIDSGSRLLFDWTE